MPQKVPNILAVDLFASGREPNVLTISAVGQVPTLGWSSGTLVRYHYVRFPDDGIQEYDFLATPPAGGSGRAIQQIPAAAVQDKPAELRGIKVYGSQDSLTVRFVTKAEVPSPAGDDFVVQSAAIVNDQLVVEVRYTGGCRKHVFELRWDGSYMESLPPQVNMQIVHDANADPCRAILRETLVFDLLDLDPSVIHLTTGFGFEAALDYRLGSVRSLALPFLRGNNTVPILRSSKLLDFAIELSTDQQKVESFKTGPDAAMRTRGMSDELDSLRRASFKAGLILILDGQQYDAQGGVKVMNGISGTLSDPLNGNGIVLGTLSTILSALGVQDDVLKGNTIVSFQPSPEIR